MADEVPGVLDNFEDDDLGAPDVSSPLKDEAEKAAFVKEFIVSRAWNGMPFLKPEEWEYLNNRIVDQAAIAAARKVIDEIMEKDRKAKGTAGREGIAAARKALSLARRPIRDGIMQAIAELRPPFPYLFTEEDKNGVARTEFQALVRNTESFIEWDSLGHWVSKYPSPEGDAPYRYPLTGLFGIMSNTRTFNEISNVFQEKNRLACPCYDYASPVDIWTKPEVAEQFKWIFYFFWRMGNDRIDEKVFRNMFHLGTYTAGQFKPYVARAIYREIRPVEWGNRYAERILDTSCGWGDRLAGFCATPTAKEYVGCDPSDRTFPVYLEQVTHYEKWLGCENPEVTVVHKGDPDGTRWGTYPHNWFRVVGKKTVEIHQLPAEDFHPEPGFDLMFSSPPYFAVEQYNADGADADLQSWKRYPGYVDWREGFFKPMLRMSYETLNPDGVMLINIIDPKVKNVRYFSFDEMVEFIRDELGGTYLGHAGMQIFKRPRDTANFRDLFYVDPNDKRNSVRKVHCEDIGVFSKRPLTLKRPSEGVLDGFGPEGDE